VYAIFVCVYKIIYFLISSTLVLFLYILACSETQAPLSIV